MGLNIRELFCKLKKHSFIISLLLFIVLLISILLIAVGLDNKDVDKKYKRNTKYLVKKFPYGGRNGFIALTTIAGLALILLIFGFINKIKCSK